MQVSQENWGEIQSVIDEIKAMLDELVAFVRAQGNPCFVAWPDNILREYLAFHAEHQSLAVVRDATMQPEAKQTLEYQLQWLAEGRRQAVLLVGDVAPAKHIEPFKQALKLAEGTLLFHGITREEVQGFVDRDELGLLLGYGIPRKPAKGSLCVVIRDENGVEKQAVVVDDESLPIVWDRSQSLCEPTDRLQCESFEQVLLERRLAGAPLSPVIGLAVGWQVNEAEIEQHWRVTDPRGDSFYFAHIIATKPEAVQALVNEWKQRIPCWSRLKLFARRRTATVNPEKPDERGMICRYSARHLERLSHVHFKR